MRVRQDSGTSILFRYVAGLKARRGQAGAKAPLYVTYVSLHDNNKVLARYDPAILHSFEASPPRQLPRTATTRLSAHSARSAMHHSRIPGPSTPTLCYSFRPPRLTPPSACSPSSSPLLPHPAQAEAALRALHEKRRLVRRLTITQHDAYVARGGCVHVSGFLCTGRTKRKGGVQCSRF